MDPHDDTYHHDPVRDELQMQLVGRNAFIVTMLGAVAFLIACFWAFVH